MSLWNLLPKWIRIPGEMPSLEEFMEHSHDSQASITSYGPGRSHFIVGAVPAVRKLEAPFADRCLGAIQIRGHERCAYSARYQVDDNKYCKVHAQILVLQLLEGVAM